MLFIVKNKMISDTLSPCKGAVKMGIDVTIWITINQSQSDSSKMGEFYGSGKNHRLPNQYVEQSHYSQYQLTQYKYYHSKVIEEEHWMIDISSLEDFMLIIKENHIHCSKVLYSENHEYPILYLNHGIY